MVSDTLTAAAQRIFEEFLGRPMDWETVTVGGDLSEILASADWAMAMRYAEAALAAVPEGEPVRYLYDFTDVATGAVTEEVSKVDRSGEPRVSNVRPLYTRPAPRPDMERQLAEAWAERDALIDAGFKCCDGIPNPELPRLELALSFIDSSNTARKAANMLWQDFKERAKKAEAERDALAADKARLEAVQKPLATMDSSELPAWLQVKELFAQFCLSEPPIRLRDELATIIAWARYGEALAAALGTSDKLAEGGGIDA